MSSSPNRLLGTVFGAVYVLVGLLGFLFPPQSGGFFSSDGGLCFSGCLDGVEELRGTVM